MMEETMTLTAADVGSVAAVLNGAGADPIAAIDGELVSITKQKLALLERGRELTAKRDELVREQLLVKEQERLRGVLGEDVQIVRAGTVATG